MSSSFCFYCLQAYKPLTPIRLSLLNNTCDTLKPLTFIQTVIYDNVPPTLAIIELPRGTTTPTSASRRSLAEHEDLSSVHHAYTLAHRALLQSTAETALVLFNFSKPVRGFSANSIQITNAAIMGFAASDDSSQYYSKIQALAGSDSGIVSLAVPQSKHHVLHPT